MLKPISLRLRACTGTNSWKSSARKAAISFTGVSHRGYQYDRAGTPHSDPIDDHTRSDSSIESTRRNGKGSYFQMSDSLNELTKSQNFSRSSLWAFVAISPS